MKTLSVKREKVGVFFTFFLMLCLLSGLFFHENVYADETDGTAVEVSKDYDADRKGSITVELQDIGTDRENVHLSLYQVGDLAREGNGFRYDWSEDFKEMAGLEGLDLNGISTAGENESMAETLRTAIKAAGSAVEPLEVQTTGASGVITFGKDASGEGILEQGVYLILEEIAGDYGTISPFLVSLPNCSDGKNWEYDITCMPKAVDLMRLGTIQVKKALKYFDGDALGELYARDSAFYVGLFLDAEGKIPYGGKGKNVKKIQIQNASSNTVTFTGIPVGTYYIFETDAEGNAIPYQELQGSAGSQEGQYYSISGEDLIADNAGQAPVIAIENQSNANGTATVSNVYLDVPDGYYMEEPETPVENNPENKENSTTSEKTQETTERRTTSKKTGDDNQILLWGGTCGAAVLCAVLILWKRRKQSR